MLNKIRGMGCVILIIQVAVVGSKPMVTELQEFVKKSNNNVKLIPYIYETPNESPYLVDKVNDGIQVIFFTGPVPYFLSLEQINKKGIPAIYIPVNELSILFSLYFVWKQLNKRPKHFSIDVPDLGPVYNVFNELNLNTDSLYLKEYNNNYNLNEIVEYHYNLWKKNKINFVLTSIRTVNDRLKKLGVRSLMMTIPKKNIHESFQKAISKGELEVSKSSQITVGFFSIDDFNEIVSKNNAPLGQEMILKMHKILIDFSKEFHASVLHIGKDQFIIYATRGGLSQVTKKYTEMKVLSQITSLIGITISVGFGFGTTAQEAEQNAYIATYKAKEMKGSTAFIVTDNKEVIGPLNKEYKEYSLRAIDQSMISISKRTNLSVSTLSALNNFFLLINYDVFSSNELAEYTQLSKRSAERIIKNLLNNGLIERAGKEQPYQKGRPRSIYKINLEKWTGIIT